MSYSIRVYISSLILKLNLNNLLLVLMVFGQYISFYLRNQKEFNYRFIYESFHSVQIMCHYTVRSALWKDS